MREGKVNSSLFLQHALDSILADTNTSLFIITDRGILDIPSEDLSKIIIKCEEAIGNLERILLGIKNKQQ